MPKKIFRHSLHLSRSIQEIADSRRGTRSLNAYIEDCIQVEQSVVANCATCSDREIADAVRRMIQAATPKDSKQCS